MTTAPTQTKFSVSALELDPHEAVERIVAAVREQLGTLRPRGSRDFVDVDLPNVVSCANGVDILIGPTGVRLARTPRRHVRVRSSDCERCSVDRDGCTELIGVVV